MADFWVHDNLYFFLRRYIDLCTRLSFRKIETVGTIPDMEGAAWLIVYNHTCTLMDPLLVLQSRKEATSFGARADTFRNPTVARFLHFCKMIPLARKNRERADEVARNAEMMGKIDQVLAHGIPFCIAPEGRHRPMHSLLPIRRGIALMAFRSAAQRPTFILPVGIEYSDWYHYRAHARMTFGEPLDVNVLAARLEGLENDARDAALQEELYKRLSAQIFFLPDDESYPERLAQAESARPQPNRVKDILLAVITSPLFVLSAVLSLPMWAIAEYLCQFKIKDKAFSNTVRYGVRLVGTPIFALLLAVLLFCLLPWWAAALLWLLFFPSYSFFYDWLNLLASRTQPPL